jgi:IPT/TIG domain
MLVNAPKIMLRMAAAVMIGSMSLFAATALTQAATTSITSLTPSSGPVGARVTIAGSGFSPTGNIVRFGSGGSVNVPSANYGTIIVYIVPTAVGPHDLNPQIMAPSQIVAPGDYQVFVVNAQMQQSNVLSFRVTG